MNLSNPIFIGIAVVVILLFALAAWFFFSKRALNREISAVKQQVDKVGEFLASFQHAKPPVRRPMPANAPSACQSATAVPVTSVCMFPDEEIEEEEEHAFIPPELVRQDAMSDVLELGVGAQELVYNVEDADETTPALVDGENEFAAESTSEDEKEE